MFSPAVASPPFLPSCRITHLSLPTSSLPLPERYPVCLPLPPYPYPLFGPINAHLPDGWALARTATHLFPFPPFFSSRPKKGRRHLTRGKTRIGNRSRAFCFCFGAGWAGKAAGIDLRVSVQGPVRTHFFALTWGAGWRREALPRIKGSLSRSSQMLLFPPPAALTTGGRRLLSVQNRRWEGESGCQKRRGRRGGRDVKKSR